MKAYYALAGVPTARLYKVTTLDAAKIFIDEVGYPVIAKPDVGVGATDTLKLSNNAELEKFFSDGLKVPYVLEEFITGEICSYDAILNSKSEPFLEAMTVWTPSVMEIVLKQLGLSYYTTDYASPKLCAAGRTTAKAGLGEVGDFVGFEVNMCPAGGYTPDMINFAQSTDVYQIWADMITSDERKLPDNGKHFYCVYASRRDCHSYKHSHEEILSRYGGHLVMCERMPDMMVPQMGNQMYTAKLADKAATEEFIKFVQEKL